MCLSSSAWRIWWAATAWCNCSRRRVFESNSCDRLKHLEDRDRIQGGFGDKGADLDVLGQLRAVRAALGAMVVVTPGAESVHGRHGVPDQIAVTQTAALLDVDGHAQFPARLLPDRGETVRVRIPRPGTAFRQNLHLHAAGVAIRPAAHDTHSAQFQQRRFGPFINFRSESAKLAFGERFVRDAVQHGSAGYPDRKSTRLNSSHIPLSRMPS